MSCTKEGARTREAQEAGRVLGYTLRFVLANSLLRLSWKSGDGGAVLLRTSLWLTSQSTLQQALRPVAASPLRLRAVALNLRGRVRVRVLEDFPFL